MQTVKIHIPKNILQQFEADCKRESVQIIDNLFEDDDLNSGLAETAIAVTVILSASHVILNTFNILRSYKDKTRFKIDFEHKGFKISMDNHTSIDEVKEKIKEIESILND